MSLNLCWNWSTRLHFVFCPHKGKPEHFQTVWIFSIRENCFLEFCWPELSVHLNSPSQIWFYSQEDHAPVRQEKKNCERKCFWTVNARLGRLEQCLRRVTGVSSSKEIVTTICSWIHLPTIPTFNLFIMLVIHFKITKLSVCLNTISTIRVIGLLRPRIMSSIQWVTFTGRRFDGQII